MGGGHVFNLTLEEYVPLWFARPYVVGLRKEIRDALGVEGKCRGRLSALPGAGQSWS
jgi:hypothetical protein